MIPQWRCLLDWTSWRSVARDSRSGVRPTKSHGFAIAQKKTGAVVAWTPATVIPLAYPHGPHNFTTLKKRLNVSDGALGMHLQTLENQGYIAGRKAFVHKRPRTTYRLTPKGRSALVRYLDAMRRLLDMVELRKPAPRG